MLISDEVGTLRSVALLQVSGQTYRIDATVLKQVVEYAVRHVQLVKAAKIVLSAPCWPGQSSL